MLTPALTSKTTTLSREVPKFQFYFITWVRSFDLYIYIIKVKGSANIASCLQQSPVLTSDVTWHWSIPTLAVLGILYSALYSFEGNICALHFVLNPHYKASKIARLIVNILGVSNYHSDYRLCYGK